MGPFIAAWFIGEGIIIWRSIARTHAPPVPGALLASSGLFALLAVVAESQRARPVAVTLAYAIDVAALMNVLPPITGGGAAATDTGIGTPPGSIPGTGPGGTGRKK